MANNSNRKTLSKFRLTKDDIPGASGSLDDSQRRFLAQHSVAMPE